MNQMKIDMDVLKVYDRAAKGGLKATIPLVAERLPYTQKAVRAALQRLKDEGYLEGKRMLRLTDKGIEALPQGVAEVFVEATERGLVPGHVTTAPVEAPPPKLSAVLAARYMVDASKLFDTIKDNIINVGRGEEPATAEEVFMVMTVCNTYNLNPFIRHIHAFRSKGKLQTPMGFDGWVHIASQRPEFLGVDYEHPPVTDMITKNGKKVFPWIKATCHIRGKVDTVVYAFADEWMEGPNWNKHPNHRLRMKAYAMAVREALGIALPDEVDAEHIVFAEKAEHQQAFTGTQENTNDLIHRMHNDQLNAEQQLGMDEVPSGIKPEDRYEPETIPQGVDHE